MTFNVERCGKTEKHTEKQAKSACFCYIKTRRRYGGFCVLSMKSFMIFMAENICCVLV